MKKIKYLLMTVIALFIFPNIVNAKETIYFQKYNVGDEIEVQVDSKNKNQKLTFTVIKASPEGEQKDVDGFVKGNEDYEYVEAIYKGTIGDKSLWDSKDRSDYSKSTVRSNLVISTTNAGWDTYEEIRLLSYEDIEPYVTLDQSGNTVGTIDSTKNFFFTNAPLWTSKVLICKPGATCPTDNPVALLINDDGVLEYKDVNEQQAKIVPVIRIHKAWIKEGMICNCENCTTDRYCPKDRSISIKSCLESGETEQVCILKLCSKPSPKVCPNDSKIKLDSCISSGKSEQDCIKKLCPGGGNIDNPKTGTYVPFGLAFISILAIGLYISLKNKTYFQK